MKYILLILAALAFFVFKKLTSKQKETQKETWLVGARLKSTNGEFPTSLHALATRGFKDISDEGIHFRVTPPKGWTRETKGKYLIVKDAKGHVRFESVDDIIDQKKISYLIDLH